MLLRRKFGDLPIYKKLLLMISTLTLTLLIVSLTAIQVTFQNNQKLLYSAISSLINTSAGKISDQISASVDMTQSMLSNQTLQKALSQIKDSQTDSPVTSFSNSYQDLSSVLYDFYYSYPTDNISYIALTANNFTLSTYNKGSKLPSKVLEDIISRTDNASGSPILITDYAHEYGVFLARTIRRIDSLQLDSLGTIIVSFDVSSLVSDSTDTISLTEDISYVLRDEGKSIPFYDSSNTDIQASNWPEYEDYGVSQIGKQKYFITKGKIASFHWEYLCLIQYNSILSSLSYVRIYCIALIFISALIIFLFSQKIIHSLTFHLHALVEKMIAFGKDDTFLPETKYDYTKRHDEIGTLHNQFDHMAHKLQVLINKNYKNELLQKDMMLKNLQNQINPHFLYNTLESINWRAKASGEKEISFMVQALGSLLRTSLSPSSNSCIQSEMQIVHNYITIQKIRFDDRLIYTEKIPSEVLKVQIPKLTIQPLVENAVRYGLETNVGPCNIFVEISIDKDVILIKILNQGSQFEEDMLEKLLSGQILPQGFGIGILNIQKRIQMLYGENYGLRLINPDDEHALSEIRLPINTQKN